MSNLDIDEDEVELTLGLSIGGCFHKRPPSTAITAVDKKESDGRDDDDDLQKRRELHALRRQEARKKREQKKNGHWNGNGNGNGFSVNNIISRSDSVTLEAQRLEARARDRAAKENEGSGSDPRSGKRNVDLTLTTNPNPNPNPNPNASPCLGAYPTNGFTVMPPATATAMQYPFHPMQYVPVGNGFHYPYMMPCWSPLQASESAMRVADGLRTEGCTAFRPFQPSDRDHNGDRRNGSDSVQNGSKGGVPSTGSTASSSSAVSDNQSDSRRGGSSSETRSQSSRPPFVQSQPQVSLSLNPNHQSGQINIAHQTETAQLTKEAAKTAIDKAQSDHSKPDHPTIPAIEPMPSTRSPPHSAPINRHNDDQDRKLGPPLPSLTHMPCVSTTGDGPNGKTITGFLYRYTKSEVSIVCVCHGRSFSPAEFIKHAGGTDISRPLKNIVVVPTNFG